MQQRAGGLLEGCSIALEGGWRGAVAHWRGGAAKNCLAPVLLTQCRCSCCCCLALSWLTPRLSPVQCNLVCAHLISLAPPYTLTLT